MAETFEAVLAASEGAVDGALRTAAAATRELRKARSGAKNGQVRDLRRALSAAQVAAAALADEARAAQAGFDVDEADYLASGAYAKELLAAAGAAGVAMFEEDERLLCYPSLVRAIPGDAAVEIDRVRERRLPPSVLICVLSPAPERGPPFEGQGVPGSPRRALQLVAAPWGEEPHPAGALV